MSGEDSQKAIAADKGADAIIVSARTSGEADDESGATDTQELGHDRPPESEFRGPV